MRFIKNLEVSYSWGALANAATPANSLVNFAGSTVPIPAGQTYVVRNLQIDAYCIASSVGFTNLNFVGVMQAQNVGGITQLANQLLLPTSVQGQFGGISGSLTGAAPVNQSGLIFTDSTLKQAPDFYAVFSESLVLFNPLTLYDIPALAINDPVNVIVTAVIQIFQSN